MKVSLIILFFLNLLFSQGTILGTVTNGETDEPIVGANVVLPELDLGTSTDQEGRYTLDSVPTGEIVLVISAVGYGTFRRKLVITSGITVIDTSLKMVPVELPMITVSSERSRLVSQAGNHSQIPGSFHLITRRELERHRYTDVHRVLQSVPGVNSQGEDGFGLRPNIGMRGSAVERSQKIALMEDGVLIAPAPYAAPSAYYFPTVGRMEKIEIRKGSSQIKYGPNTNGGALNLISTSIPSMLTLRTRIQVGAFNSSRVHAYVGDSGERFGWLAEAHLYQSNGFKLLDNGGNTGFRKKDLMAKIRYNSSKKKTVFHSFELKLGMTDEISHETYLGLAEKDFRTSPYRRYLASQSDQMDADHYQSQLRHYVRLRKNFDITTTVYYHTFYRNWYKLDTVMGEKIAAILLDPEHFASAYNLLFAYNSQPDQYQIRANKRGYISRGVQSLLHFTTLSSRGIHTIELGLRYHEDSEDRFEHLDHYQMVNKELILKAEGAAGSLDNRIGSAAATSLFIQDQFHVGNLSVVPGARYESIVLVRRDFGKDDPDRKGESEVHANSVRVLIPGFGFNFSFRPSLVLFSGIHKGFSPPLPGKDSGVMAEESINAEAGFRLRRYPLYVEAATFLNHYHNMLGSDASAVGGQGTGNQFNAGKVQVYGFELYSRYVAKKWNSSFPLEFSYTFTHAEFRNDFESKFKPWGSVRRGDRVPYIPDQQFSIELGVESGRWRINLNGKYVSAMRTRAGHGRADPTELTDSPFIVDVSSEVTLSRFATIFLVVRNIADQAYIVARRPAGIRPGLPRTIMAGARIDF